MISFDRMESASLKRAPGLMSAVSLVWKRIDHPGHEWCSLTQHSAGATLQGVAVIQWERRPCRIEYIVRCNAGWETRTVLLMGNIGAKRVAVQIKADSKGHWLYNGEGVSSVQGCIDVDLGFSPSTNLLPIRRIKLLPGQSQDITAAWVEFPSLKLKALHQRYTRIDAEHIHYESAGGKFRRDLRINRHGLVLNYPDFWQAEEAI